MDRTTVLPEWTVFLQPLGENFGLRVDGIFD